MLEGVSARFRVALQVDEVAGWSQPDIVRIVRERRSDVVILPMLSDNAGPLTRWKRRDLVSALITQTQAVVVDEYERPLVGQPVTCFRPAPVKRRRTRD